MGKYIILISNKAYCGDDCEPGHGQAIIFKNKKSAKISKNFILKNWALNFNDNLKIKKAKKLKI